MLMRASKRLAVTFNTLAIITVAFFFAPRSYGDTLVTLPDWNDEAAAYSSQGLDTSGADQHISDGRYSSNIDKFTGLANIADTHDNTEGDDLWTAYQMYKRLNGIHQNAADDWLTRAQNLANYFKNSYVGGSAWAEDASFNFDHIYGWGLCEWASAQSDAAAIATVDQIVSEMVAWNASDFVVAPSDSLFNVGTGGRRWARQLRLAVCAAEMSPSATNLSWRDKVVDIVLQAPEWDATRKMYWLGRSPTNNGSRLGAGAYENGQRIAITFHMGIWMDALWHAWRVLDAEQDARAAAVSQRLVDMATFYRDIPLDSNGFLQLHLGYNINTGAAINTGGDGAPDGVYSVAPINGLVMAYKFTGDQSYLNRAWTLYKNWQESQSQSAGQVDHFVDSDIASATAFRFLANNKGELQYVYALFENGGDPVVVGGSSGASGPGPKPMPPTFNNSADDPATATVTISANPSIVDPGMTATLTWSTTEADSCDASGGWTGARGTSGTEETPILAATTRFTLTCDGTNGTASDSTIVSVRGAGGVSGGIPSWYSSAPDKTWINLNTAIGSKRYQDFGPKQGFADDPAGWSYTTGNPHEGALRKWSGATARGDHYVMAFGGGHLGGEMNVVYEFGPFASEAPDWHWYGTDPESYEPPSHNLNWSNEKGRGYYSDGKPASRHNYSHLIWVPDLGNNLGRVVFAPWGTGIWDDNAAHTNKAASFKFTSDSSIGGFYESEGTYTNWPASTSNHGGGGVYDSTSGLIWIYAPGPRALYSYNMVNDTYSLRSTGDGPGGTVSSVAVDPERRIMIVHKNAGGTLQLGVFDIDTQNIISGSQAGDFVAPVYQNTGWTSTQVSIVYEPVGKKFVGYVGGTSLYTLEPPANYRSGGSLNPNATWVWTQVSNGVGGAAPPADADEGGIQNRLQYIESIKGLAVTVNSGQNGADSSMFVFKIPQEGL